MFGLGRVFSLERDYELLQLSNQNDKNKNTHSSGLIITLFLSSRCDGKEHVIFKR